MTRKQTTATRGHSYTGYKGRRTRGHVIDYEQQQQNELQSQ